MKTLIIIALVYFLVKRNKPHIPIIRGIAKTVSSIAIGLVKLYNNIVYFWTLVFMEFSVALAADEEGKAIREDYAGWLIWNKSKIRTFTELNTVFPNDINKHDVETRLGNRSWANYSKPREIGEGPIAMSVITIITTASLCICAALS